MPPLSNYLPPRSLHHMYPLISQHITESLLNNPRFTLIKHSKPRPSVLTHLPKPWALFLFAFMISYPCGSTGWAYQMTHAAWPPSESSRRGNCWAGNCWVGISASLLGAVQIKPLYHGATKFCEICGDLVSAMPPPLSGSKYPEG